MKGNRAVLTAIVVVVVIILGWWLFGRGGGGARVDLLERFGDAQKRPNAEVFSLVDATLAGETKRAIAINPATGTRLTWKVRVPDDGWLWVSVGMKPEAWDKEGDGIKFLVGVSDGRAYEELFTQHVNPFAQQTPIVDNPIVYFSSLPSLLSQTGVLFPQNVFGIQRDGAGTPTIMNYSFGVQRNVGWATVLDVAYVASLGRHQLWRRNINPVPMGANFNPANADPTNRANPLSPSFLRPIIGHNNIQISEWASSSSYHSMPRA